MQDTFVCFNSIKWNAFALFFSTNNYYYLV